MAINYGLLSLIKHTNDMLDRLLGSLGYARLIYCCFYPVIIPMGDDLAAYARPMAILPSFSAPIDVILSSIVFKRVLMDIYVFVRAYAYEQNDEDANKIS